MAASSVPIRPDVRNTMEDLTAAGVRFVYFSPRNMKRSKPIAEKIGISFDWNCAISLRDLEGNKKEILYFFLFNSADFGTGQVKALTIRTDISQIMPIGT